MKRQSIPSIQLKIFDEVIAPVIFKHPKKVVKLSDDWSSQLRRESCKA